MKISPAVPQSQSAPVALAPLAQASLRPDEMRLVRDNHGDHIVRGDGTQVDVPTTPTLDPEWAVWVRYGRYLLDLPGAAYIRVSSAEKGIIRVGFEAPELALLAHGAINDAIDGERFIWEAPDRPLPQTPPPPFNRNWWEATLNITRAISGVRGVVNIDRGVGGATAWATSQQYLDELKPLFRRQMLDGSWLGWYVWPNPPGGSRPVAAH